MSVEIKERLVRDKYLSLPGESRQSKTADNTAKDICIFQLRECLCLLSCQSGVGQQTGLEISVCQGQPN